MHIPVLLVTHPSVFTLSPHLTKCGDSIPYEERFIRVSQTAHFGMVGPTLEWWVLLAHLGINGSFNPLPWMKHE